MITISIRDTANGRFYRAHVSLRWANRHDNGALISCGLTIDAVSAWDQKTVYLTRRAFETLRKRNPGLVQEVSQEAWNHSGCQSSCKLRGAAECRW